MSKVNLIEETRILPCYYRGNDTAALSLPLNHDHFTQAPKHAQTRRHMSYTDVITEAARPFLLRLLAGSKNESNSIYNSGIIQHWKSPHLLNFLFLFFFLVAYANAFPLNFCHGLHHRRCPLFLPPWMRRPPSSF